MCLSDHPARDDLIYKPFAWRVYVIIDSDRDTYCLLNRAGATVYSVLNHSILDLLLLVFSLGLGWDQIRG